MIIAIGAHAATTSAAQAKVARALFVLAAPIAAFAAGCAPEPVTATGAPPIARVWASRCGACHSPVEPGSRTKSHLDDALARHKARVPLTDAQWSELRDFLSGPGVQTAAASAPRVTDASR